MGRTPLPKDEALQPLNVKVPSEDLSFVQEVLKPAMGVSYNADAVRVSWFSSGPAFGSPATSSRSSRGR